MPTQINYKPIIMDEKKDKRVLNIELDENVKKVSITGLGDDETVVMKQELSEEELDQATGGEDWDCVDCKPHLCGGHGCFPLRIW